MKKLMIICGLLLAACINPQETPNKAKVIASMADAIAKKYSGAPQLSIEELKQNQGKLVLVDVRSEEEIKVSKIRGAVTRKYFESQLSAQPDFYKDYKVVAYCTIGQRSSQYATQLKKKGLDAYNLKESILGWAHRKLPLITPSGEETKKVHVYGEAWNLLPEGYQGIWKD